MKENKLIKEMGNSSGKIGNIIIIIFNTTKFYNHISPAILNFFLNSFFQTDHTSAL